MRGGAAKRMADASHMLCTDQEKRFRRELILQKLRVARHERIVSRLSSIASYLNAQAVQVRRKEWKDDEVLTECINEPTTSQQNEWEHDEVLTESHFNWRPISTTLTHAGGWLYYGHRSCTQPDRLRHPK